MAVTVSSVDAYLSEFDRFERQQGPRDPPWVGELRKAAIQRFAEAGFPTIKNEDWKYTNVAPIAKTPFRIARVDDGHGIVGEKLEAFAFGMLRATQLVFVNGRYAPRLSWHRPLPSGVRATSLAEALRDDPGSVQPVLGQFALSDRQTFTALNTAFFRDGAYVHIPQATILEEPIHLLFLSTVSPEPTVSHPRNVIILGPRSQASIIESYASLEDGGYLTNAVTEIVAGPEAVLRRYKLGRESEKAFHVARTEIVQDRNTKVASNSISLGGALVRDDLNTRFRGEGGELALEGLYMVSGRQHFDTHTIIDHTSPSNTSRELYKGILDGSSRGVFNGKIFVRRGAQKTVARQTNKNLLLSNDAFVDSTPGLEILADDVKCNHGSTIGQLDEDAIFYMRTRGIDESTARNMLTYAFAAEIINLVHLASMRVKVNELVLSRLPYGRQTKEIL